MTKKRRFKHSPGSWRWYNARQSRILKSYHICDVNGRRIATVAQIWQKKPATDDSPEQLLPNVAEEFANAQLMAASSEMLDALLLVEAAFMQTGKNLPKVLQEVQECVRHAICHATEPYWRQHDQVQTTVPAT